MVDREVGGKGLGISPIEFEEEPRSSIQERKEGRKKSRSLPNPSKGEQDAEDGEGGRCAVQLDRMECEQAVSDEFH